MFLVQLFYVTFPAHPSESVFTSSSLPPCHPQVLQASDLPAGLVSIIPGSRDRLTAALANHNVIKAIWYWGSAEVQTRACYITALLLVMDSGSHNVPNG